MRNSAVATSVRLPDGMDIILDKVVKKLHTTRTNFIRQAIIDRLEDELDISLAEEVMKRNERTYSLEEVKSGLGLED